ncbi:MAG: hypothetical protein ACXACU_18035 [Candidatus Hodarchaeales archaeon]|jgi:hypothetical protein
MIFKELKETRMIVRRMPINSFFRKVKGKREISQLLDFQEELENLISKVGKRYKESKELEEELKKIYDEKMSNLDFRGSKQSVENSKRQLVETLDIEVQLEFLTDIQKLIPFISQDRIGNPDQFNDFQKVAYQILNPKKIKSRSNRKFLLRKFQKFISRKDSMPSVNHPNSQSSDMEVDDIINDLMTKKDTKKIDSEIDEILAEIKQKNHEE